jgi:hypothetical protein
LTYVLNDVAVIADEEDRAALGQVDLHSDQTVSVARKVVQRDALAEIEAALVEGLPVAVERIVSKHINVSGRRRWLAASKAIMNDTYRSNLR